MKLDVDHTPTAMGKTMARWIGTLIVLAVWATVSSSLVLWLMS